MGGSETFLMNLYRNIDRHKIQFDFVVHTNEICDFDQEIERLGGIIYRIPPISKHPIKNIKSLIYILKNNQYDTIHRHTNSSIVFTDLLVAKIMGIKNRYAHAHSNQSQKAKFIHKLCRPLLNALATKKFACSQSAAEWLFGRRNIKKVKIIYNAIDIEKYLFSEKERRMIRNQNKVEDRIVIGNVGRMEKAKNHLFIIDVFYEIQKKNDNYVLWLIGDGSLKEVVQKKVRNLKLEDKVIFWGIRNDVNKLLKGMDIFLFPSIYEGLGISLIEAQMSGIKCFVSEAIQEEAIITERVRRLKLDEGPEKWAENILNENKDYSRTINRKLDKIKQFSISELINNFEKIYLGD